MPIDQAALKNALGPVFDPEGDYVCCGHGSAHIMDTKGYRRVGVVQDSTQGDSTLLVYDRKPAAPVPTKKKIFSFQKGTP